MPSVWDYLRGVAAEYGPTLKQAAAEEAAELAVSVDTTLRDPRKARKLVRAFFGGVREVWKACPHGTPQGEPCEQCPKPKERRIRLPKTGGAP